MNRAELIGNLVRDPEYRKTQNEKSVCTFTIAINRRSNREEADFLNIVTWNNLADNCYRYLKKGRKVGVVGHIETRSYETQAGEKRTATEIIADEVEFIGGAEWSQ